MAKNLSEMIDEHNKLLEDLRNNKKIDGEKKVKIPNLSMGKKKKNFIIVHTISSTGIHNFRKLPIVDGNIKLPNKTYHIAEAEYLGWHKKDPMLTLPEWSNEPITMEVLTRKVEENKSNIRGQKHIIDLMESARLAEIPKGGGGKKGIIIFLLLGVGVYLIGSQLGWF